MLARVLALYTLLGGSLNEELGILARIARALFPDEPVSPDTDPFEWQPGFHSHGWEQIRGLWTNKTGEVVAVRQVVHIPGLRVDRPMLIRAERGKPPADPTTRDLIADPGVSAAIPEGWVLIREDMVMSRGSAADLRVLVRALDAARRAPWQKVADSLSLRLDPRALSIVGRTGGLLAVRENFDVRIHEERRHTRIRVGLGGELPDDFRIAPGVPDLEDKLHHPILDRGIVAKGVSSDLRRRLLSVEEPLMNLLAERPQSDITAQRVRVVVPGRALSELETLVEDALKVARALSVRG